MMCYFFFFIFFLLLDILASDIAMAMACLRDVTIGPFLDPLCRVPVLYSCMTFVIFFAVLFFISSPIFLMLVLCVLVVL